MKIRKLDPDVANDFWKGRLTHAAVAEGTVSGQGRGTALKMMQDGRRVSTRDGRDGIVLHRAWGEARKHA